jgi:methoxymalonate biosynthesis acyl carrier protein
MTDPREMVRRFVMEHTNQSDLDDGVDLFAVGLVSSLFAVQIVMWLERTFGVPVTEDDLELANFTSVDAIVGFIESKRSLTGQAT